MSLTTSPRDGSPDEVSSSAGPLSLAIDVRVDGDRQIVTVAGEVDLATGARLRDTVTHLLSEAGPGHLVLDLERVTFIDSIGLGILVAIHRKTAAARGSLSLVANDRIAKVMEVTGLSRVFTFQGSAAEAVEPTS